MRVTVKFFSYLQQITGTDQISVDLAGGAMVSELINSLCEKYNSSALKNDQISIMINHKVISPNAILKEGDQVLLLPIMEGG